MLAIYIHLASSEVYDYHAKKIKGQDKEAVSTKIKQPIATGFDRIVALEAVVKTLLSEKYAKEGLLDKITQQYPQGFMEEPLTTPPLDKSVEEIESAVKSFNVEKAIEEEAARNALK